MYNTWIPIMPRKFSKTDRERLVSELKRANPEYVMLVYSRILNNPEFEEEVHNLFVECKTFLEENGFRVGVWVAPTIGYGAPYYFDNDAPYTHLHTITGEDIPGAYCTLYDDFAENLCSIFKKIASTGVKEILLEDDYTQTGGKVKVERIACCCEKHMEIFRERLGEDITREELHKKVLLEGPNKYRDLWLEIQGETLIKITEKIEKAVHSVDPDIRIGLSANWTSFAIEGVPHNTLAKIIAGKNRPFVRLTGAPYWGYFPNPFITAIEGARTMSSWYDNDVELLSEGDTFPRPRHHVSSAKLENFYTILRADKKTEGSLKYMVDYNSSATYEKGYIDRHIRNAETYKEIDKRFTGETVGLNVLQVPQMFKTVEFSEDNKLEHYNSTGLLLTVSNWFVSENPIPTTYENKEGATLVFGEAAKYVTEDILKRGVILDATAAKILMSNGIDVGIKNFERVNPPLAEKFLDEDETIIIASPQTHHFYKYTLDENAKVLSELYYDTEGLAILSPKGLNEEQKYPSCYLYENKDGLRFMVYSFAAESFGAEEIPATTTLFRNYMLPRELAKGIKFLQNGESLPAICFDNPDLYILCKKDGNKLTVGIWNIFQDEAITPEIILDKEYKNLDCYNCDGVLDGDKVKLKTDIPPYSFVCFTVE